MLFMCFAWWGLDHKLGAEGIEHFGGQEAHRNANVTNSSHQSDNDQRKEESAENRTCVILQVFFAREAVDEPNEPTDSGNGPKDGIADIAPSRDVIRIATTRHNIVLLFSVQAQDCTLSIAHSFIFVNEIFIEL